MVRAYQKSLHRMFGANILRISAISLIIAIGIAVTTGICALPQQMRDATNSRQLSPQSLFVVGNVADKIELIGYVFPPFFIFVSCLTALITMTRLIEEERPVFACYKTLGYSDFAILLRYLVFASVCAGLGCAIGLAAGDLLLRPIIFGVIRIKFDLPDVNGLYVDFGFVWSAGMSAAILVCTLIIGILRCRQRPAMLLRPKSPKAGKNYFGVYPLFWRRLKFKFKSALRNIFRYKMRFVMTVVSVAGATIMVFAGLGFWSILSTAHKIKIFKE